MRWLCAVLFVTSACISPLGSSWMCSPATRPVHPAATDASYAHVQRLACHNCYERQYAPSLAAALDHTRNIEIDFYDQDNALAFGASRPGAWYVRHGLTGGNHNNCTVRDGRNDLRACLLDVAAWCEDHPGHEVVTIFLDKKQGWGPGRMPADLDALLDETLGERLYRPGELRGAHPTLRRAARAGAWPRIDGLRGRVLAVMTGGTLIGLGGNRGQCRYVEARGGDARMFVAPDILDRDDIRGVPHEFTEAAAESVVFLNLPARKAALAAEAAPFHYVSRVWGTESGHLGWSQLIATRVNLVALFDIGLTPP